MNKEQAKNKIEILEKELEELKEIINKEDKGHWKPKVGDNFWVIGGSGNIHNIPNVGSKAVENTIAIGNYFKTEKEAEDMVKYKKIMNKYCYRFSVDELKDKQIIKYFLYLDKNTDELVSDWDHLIYGSYLFKTEEDAQKAINELTPELFLNCVGK